VLFLQRLDIARSLGMVPSADDQPGVWQGGGHNLVGLDHELEPFVGSPFAECQDAVLRVAAPGKIRIFGSARQNAMGSDMNVVATVLFVEDGAIAWHQYGH
jgi:hypothetical protein